MNAQAEDFRYTISGLQELTELFVEHTPYFISLLDMSSGSCHFGISHEYPVYIAFNTCSGTYKFFRLPMGLRQSPNFFQLLMDKISNGL